MYVCLCNGVSDGQIREAIFEGCCSYKEVREQLGVGTQCGKCACLAKQITRDTLGEVQASRSVAFFQPAYAVA